MSVDRYGRVNGCVKTPRSSSGEIDLDVDGMSIRDGGLIFTGGDPTVDMAFGPGHGQAAFTARCIDGHTVAIEHRSSEVVR